MFVTDILNLVERAAAIDLIMPILSFSVDTGGFQGGKRMHEGSVMVYTAILVHIQHYNLTLTGFIHKRTSGKFIPRGP